MTTVIEHDLLFLHPPRITPELFALVLHRNHSPAAVEADVLYAIPPISGIDPALALAFFHHESGYGMQGSAMVTKNWGNLRHGQGHALGTLGGFATYRTWADGLRDWCTLIAASYVIGRHLTTVRAVLPIYAPSSDGNAPARYAESVIADVARWMSEDGAADPHAGETHYKVKKSCTAGCTIRSAPRKNAAVIGRLSAGDDWYGESIPGGLVTLAGFGSGSTWIRDSTMKCVWSGLLERVSS